MLKVMYGSPHYLFVHVTFSSCSRVKERVVVAANDNDMLIGERR